jgi:hypothetical protein
MSEFLLMNKADLLGFFQYTNELSVCGEVDLERDRTFFKGNPFVYPNAGKEDSRIRVCFSRFILKCI